MNRRQFIRTAAAGGVALAQVKPVRMGFIGVGARGTELLRRILTQAEVEVPVICDVNEQSLNRAAAIVEKARGKRPEGFARGPQDYRRMLARTDFNAVLIATPQDLHAAMAVDALKTEKFVGSEVPACTTLEECRELVRMHQKTGAGYMLLENYCYSRPVMQVLHMAQNGAFGELTYAECAYIHEIRNLRFNADGTLTWRGQNAAKNRGNLYPTHAIGPVAHWMGIGLGAGPGDRMVSLVAMDSKAASARAYAGARFGKDSAAANVEFRNGDTTNALIRTAQGRLIEIRYDTSSPRPSGMGQYSLQGTRGAYESAFGEHKVYLEGRSPQHRWEALDKYDTEFMHPYWAERGEQARKTGHGGGDYFVISDFLEAIRTGISPIDVYAAVTWSAIRPLSAASLAAGFGPVEFPEFK